MSTFSLLISPPDALQPGFTERTVCRLCFALPRQQSIAIALLQPRSVASKARFKHIYTTFYITERSATTRIATHPELRLMA